MKKILINIFNYLYEVFLWFVLYLAAALSIAFSVMLPKHAAVVLIFAIGSVVITRTYNRFITK